MSPRDWMVPVAAGVAGLGIGLAVPRGTEEIRPAVPRPEVAERAPAASPASAPTAFTLDDIRNVVREEIAARAPDPVRPAPAADDAAAPPSAVESRAAATLDAAIARRTWTEADADALRDDFTQMTATQRTEWLRRYSVAVNQGRLIPETERGPM